MSFTLKINTSDVHYQISKNCKSFDLIFYMVEESREDEVHPLYITNFSIFNRIIH